MPKKKKAKPNKRFANLTESDIDKVKEDNKKANTIRADKKCEKAFIEYLQAKGFQNLEYWNYSTEDLNNILSKFWFEIRNQEGEMYRVSTLKHYRYSLNRCLQRRGLETDLVHSPCYTPSHKAFRDACSQLKKAGLCYVESYPEICPTGQYLSCLSFEKVFFL